jgi:hypothetical protein
MSDPTKPSSAPEVENPGAGDGMVVLDIGGDVGALVVSTPAELAGVEIEICPVGARDGIPDEGGDWWVGEWRSSGHPHAHDHDHPHDHDHSHDDGPAWPHVAVLARTALSSGGSAAVFPGLRAGRYDVWCRPDGPTALTVEVVGGAVTAVDWPSGQGH